MALQMRIKTKRVQAFKPHCWSD